MSEQINKKIKSNTKYKKKGSIAHSQVTTIKFRIRKISSITLPIINEQVLQYYLTLWKIDLINIWGDNTVNYFENTLYKCSLKKPRKPYLIFVSETVNKLKRKYLSLNEVNNIMKRNWETLSQQQKELYKQKSKKEFCEYRNELTVVKYILFLGYDGIKRKRLKPFDSFKAMRIIEEKSTDKYTDKKLFNKTVREYWKKRDKFYKEVDIKDVEALKTLHKIAQNLKKESAQLLFIQEQLQKDNNNNNDNNKDNNNNDNEKPKLIKASTEWGNLPEETKKKYYADYFTNCMKNELLINTHNLIHYKEIKKPPSPFQLFRRDIRILYDHQKKISTFDYIKLYHNLNSDTVQLYQKKSQRLKLAFIYQKVVHKKRLLFLFNQSKTSSKGFDLYLNSKKGQELIEQGITKESIKFLYNRNIKLKNICEKHAKIRLNKIKEEKKYVLKTASLNPMKKAPTEFQIFCKKNKEDIYSNELYTKNKNYIKTASMLFKDLNQDKLKELITKRLDIKQELNQDKKIFTEYKYHFPIKEEKKILPKKSTKNKSTNDVNNNNIQLAHENYNDINNKHFLGNKRNLSLNKNSYKDKKGPSLNNKKIKPNYYANTSLNYKPNYNGTHYPTYNKNEKVIKNNKIKKKEKSKDKSNKKNISNEKGNNNKRKESKSYNKKYKKELDLDEE